ncbi:preprotein translocase subunit SecE [Alicyclobacillus tolerans]|uniref:preprotein translocase subunit SecE n=1 Tax=Alicyclobacillus tolerans TaxID=90970 RepID=UPI001F023272|nr:preprotein translocase subunit SecE [Alicyclobacillus tolerans]MCF8566024.1 preprotein translocase subunit SecE [Alicyclobacillus tolerans]
MAKPSEKILQPKRRKTGVVAFFRESLIEIKRVRWPGRQEVINYTTAAVLTTIVMGLLVWGFDLGIAKLMSLIGLV